MIAKNTTWSGQVIITGREAFSLLTDAVFER